jgi:hypothetical protein
MHAQRLPTPPPLPLRTAGMRAVDLSCLLLAPLMSGLLMTYAGLGWAVGAILACNSVAVLPEMALLRAAYSRSQGLRC